MSDQLTLGVHDLGDGPEWPPVPAGDVVGRPGRENFLAAMLAEWTWPGKQWEKRPEGQRQAAVAAAQAAFRMMQDAR